METALGNWLGIELNDLYGESTECCSLKITLPDDFPIAEGETEYECYSYTPIDKKYIKYLKTNKEYLLLGKLTNKSQPLF